MTKMDRVKARGISTFLVASLCVLNSCSGAARPVTNDDTKLCLEVHDLNGNEFCFSPKPRCPVVVKFMATWCESCTQEMRSFQAALLSIPQGLRPPVLLVGVLDSAESLRVYREHLSVPMGMAIDDESKLQQRVALPGIPGTAALGLNGEQLPIADPVSGAESKLLAGPRDWTTPASRTLLQEMCRPR